MAVHQPQIVDGTGTGVIDRRSVFAWHCTIPGLPASLSLSALLLLQDFGSGTQVVRLQCLVFPPSHSPNLLHTWVEFSGAEKQALP